MGRSVRHLISTGSNGMFNKYSLKNRAWSYRVRCTLASRRQSSSVLVDISQWGNFRIQRSPLTILFAKIRIKFNVSIKYTQILPHTRTFLMELMTSCSFLFGFGSVVVLFIFSFDEFHHGRNFAIKAQRKLIDLNKKRKKNKQKRQPSI